MNDVGVQSRQEMDEVWLAHSIAGVWGDTSGWEAHLNVTHHIHTYILMRNLATRNLSQI